MATRRSRFSKRARKSIARRRVRIVGKKSKVTQPSKGAIKKEALKDQPVRNFPFKRNGYGSRFRGESADVSTTTTSTVTTTTVSTSTTTSTSTTIVTTTTLAPTTTTTLAPTTTSTTSTTVTTTTVTVTTTTYPQLMESNYPGTTTSVDFRRNTTSGELEPRSHGFIHRAGSSYALTSIKFEMRVVTSNPGGNLWVEIYSDNAGLPNTLLRSSSLVAGSSITSLQFYEFILTSPLNLTLNFDYHVILRSDSTIDGAKWFTLNRGVGNVIANHHIIYSTGVSDTTWAAQTSHDHKFELWGRPSLPTTTTSTTTTTTVVTTTTLAPTTTTLAPPVTTTTTSTTTTAAPSTTTTTLAPTTTTTTSTVTTTTSTVTTTTAPELVLLMHMNDVGLTDDSPYAHNTSLQGGMGRSAVQSKWGGFSAFFDGSDDLIVVTNSQRFHLAANEFTLEAWVYRTAGASASEYIIGTKNSGTSEGYDLYMNASEVVVFEYHQLGSPHPLRQFTTSIVLGNNAWIHVAIVRDGSTLRAFKNGVAAGTFAMPASTIRGLSTHFYVGARSGLTNHWSGYIEEVRLINGSAKWTSGFTPQGPYNPPTSTTTTTSITTTTTVVTTTTEAPTTTTLAPTTTTTTLAPTTTTLAPTTTTSTSTSTTAPPTTTTTAAPSTTTTTVVTTTTAVPTTTTIPQFTETWGDRAVDDHNNRIEDCSLNENSPTFNNGAVGSLVIGNQSDKLHRPLFRFNVKNDIFQATIISATLYIRAATAPTGGNLSANVYRVLQDWVELQATHNIYSTGNSWNTVGCEAANDSGVDDDASFDRHATATGGTITWTDNTYSSVDVTDIVQDWVNGTHKEYGFILISTIEGTTNRYHLPGASEGVDALQPYLEITYTGGTALTTTTTTTV